MTRRTNLLTLRKYFAWRSIWFQTDSYQGLVVRDLVINTFLSGIFRRLGIVSGHFSIRSTIFNINIVETELFFFHKKRILPLFFLDFSFFKSFNTLILFFRSYISEHSLVTNFIFTKKYFTTLLIQYKNYVYHFLYTLCPYLYLLSRSVISNFFFKSNLLYSSYNPIIHYIYYKQQFNFFFFFLNATTKSRFSTVSELKSLQRSMSPLYTRPSKLALSFLSSRTNIFHQFSSRIHLNKVALSFRSKIQTREPTFLLKRTKQQIVQAVPSKYLHGNTSSSFPFSYSLVFVLTTYFNMKSSSYLNMNLYYLYLLVRVSPILKSTGETFNNSFFFSIERAFQKLQKRTSLLFFYWTFKLLWISFFNSSFFTFLERISLKLRELFSDLNNIYYFVFFIFEQHKYSFFYNTLYITLLRQFNKFLCSDHSITISFYKNALKYLYDKIEHSLCSYTESTFYFFPRFFFETPAFITNSKIVCEYLTMCLLNGLTISSAYRKVSRWHRLQREYIKTKMSFFKNKRPDLHSHFYKSQLKGIRIICSGPPYKARRKMRKRYHLWLAREFVTGIMPLQSFKYNIDYYQSFVRLKRSSIGIKVWTLFEKYEDKVFW